MKTFEVLENLKDWILLTSFEVFFQPRRIDVINPVTSFPRRIGGFYLILVSLILIRENLRGSWKPQRLDSPNILWGFFQPRRIDVINPVTFFPRRIGGFYLILVSPILKRETFEVLENLKGWIPLTSFEVFFQPRRIDVINLVTFFPRRIGGFYLILVSPILKRGNLRGSWKPQRLDSPNILWGFFSTSKDWRYKSNNFFSKGHWWFLFGFGFSNSYKGKPSRFLKTSKVGFP